MAYTYDFDDDVDLVPGTEGFDTERKVMVTFVRWTDEDQNMVEVEDADGLYITYPEEIEWFDVD